jgi:hypothetical protein
MILADEDRRDVDDAYAPLHCSSKWTDDRGVLIRYHERQFRCQESLGIAYLQAAPFLTALQEK